MKQPVHEVERYNDMIKDFTDDNIAKPAILFYKQTQINLPFFLAVKNLPKNYYTLGKELLVLYNEFPEKQFSFKLFIFLLKNSHILFAHKKRVFPWISYTKNAFRFSKANYLA